MEVSRNDDDAELDAVTIQTDNVVLSVVEKPNGRADIKISQGDDVAEGESLTVLDDLRVLHNSDEGEDFVFEGI